MNAINMEHHFLAAFRACFDRRLCRLLRLYVVGPYTFDIEGKFSIRGVTKTEKLTLTSDSKGTPSGSLDGTMAFDRKDYGMTSGIPFIKIANRVEVNVRLKWRWVSGAPPVFQQ
jgi:hypothetical protein